MNKKDFLRRYEEWGIDQKNALHFKEQKIIRINSSLNNPKKILQRLDERKVFTEKIEFLSYGYRVDTAFPLASMIEYLLGYFYIQESSAQIPGEIIKEFCKSKKFDELKILDMCAAPGGKTTHISEILKNKGKIVALDNSKKRTEKLIYNLERMRTQNVTVYETDALTFLAEKDFDIVLIDAPCSGNFTQDEDWFEKRNLEGIKEKAELQKKLITKAKDMLTTNGIIIYATCSLEKEENEDVIEYALSKNLTLIDSTISVGRDGLTEKTTLCKRFLPSDNFPGFFIAVLQKNE